MSPAFQKKLEDLFRTEYPALFYYAAACLKDPLLAEDAVQDTFCEALNHPEELSCHPHPAAWLTQTLKYKIQKLTRQQTRDLRRQLPLDTLRHASVRPKEPESQASILQTAKAVLTPEEYRLLILLTIEKVSHETAAQELGISVSASYKRLERIRKKLKLHL